MNLPLVLDPLLISLYRITGNVIFDYFLGTLMLALATVLLGKLTISLVLRYNQKHNAALEKELEDKHRISMAALETNDKQAYRACNNQANEVFGRYFFNMTAHSAALLWPVPIALAWMQSRFLGVQFEFIYPISLIWPSTGYFTTFLLCYVLARILMKNLGSFLSSMHRVQSPS